MELGAWEAKMWFQSQSHSLPGSNQSHRTVYNLLGQAICYQSVGIVVNYIQIWKVRSKSTLSASGRFDLGGPIVELYNHFYETLLRCILHDVV